MNVHSSIFHKHQKEEMTQMSITDEWINKMWYIHTTECYLALKKNEILIHSTIWISLENTMANKSQSKMAPYSIILFI